MKTYWYIKHEDYGNIDPKTGLFIFQTGYLIHLDKRIDNNKGLTPAIDVTHYANKETALWELRKFRKDKAEWFRKKLTLIKVTVTVRDKSKSNTHG